MLEGFHSKLDAKLDTKFDSLTKQLHDISHRVVVLETYNTEQDKLQQRFYDRDWASLNEHIANLEKSLKGVQAAGVQELQAQRASFDLNLTEKTQTILETENRLQKSLLSVAQKVDGIAASIHLQENKMSIMETERKNMEVVISEIKDDVGDLRNDVTALQITFAERYGLPALFGALAAGVIQVVTFVLGGK